MWQRTQERLKQRQPRLITLFTVKQTSRAERYEQADINFLSYKDSLYTNNAYSLRKPEVFRYDKVYPCFYFFKE